MRGALSSTPTPGRLVTNPVRWCRADTTDLVGAHGFSPFDARAEGLPYAAVLSERSTVARRSSRSNGLATKATPWGNSRWRAALYQGAEEADPIEVRHLDVRQDEVGQTSHYFVQRRQSVESAPHIVALLG